MTEPPWLPAMRAEFIEVGFDICETFNWAWYNASVSDSKLQLDPFGCGDSLGLLVANTKNLWSPFIKFLSRHHLWRSRKHPVHDYVEFHIRRIVARHLDVGFDIHFVHERDPGRLVAMQQLGEIIALAYYSRESHLSVHPKFGPWFAFRAAIVVDKTGPCRPPPVRLKSPISQKDEVRVKDAMAVVLKAVATDTAPTIDVRFRGRPGYFEAWLAVRDAINVGNETWRFSEDQILYHYTTDRAVLARLCGWAHVDVVVVGTAPPCPRCGQLAAMVIEVASELNLQSEHFKCHHVAWDTPAAVCLVGEGSGYAHIGTAHQVADTLNLNSDTDWPAVAAAEASNNVAALDCLLSHIEKAAKETAWLMTPVLIVNGRVVWYGSVPERGVVLAALQEAASSREW
mmetsp:Transcript_13902/g.35489  ORF Transcript_13902/g.35489 Transcript_13902/m.35489 type:complete len:399 (+) Transcript_13902:62-1258(+)